MTTGLLHGRSDSCNVFVCVSLDAPAFDDDHHNYDDFPKLHLQSGLICFISPNTSPPPTLCHFLFLQNSRFFMRHTHAANRSGPHSHRKPLCATLTPHIALLTSHDACVTHTTGGSTVLAFFGLVLLFGLIWCSCECKKKSEKIIVPTSAALNIEMTTPPVGEAALPDSTAAQTYQSISQGNARVADKGEEVQVV